MRLFNNPKHLPAFTLAEVMIALFMLGTVISAVISLQTTTLYSLSRTSAKLINIIDLSSFFVRVHMQQSTGKEVKTLKEQKEGVTFEYEQKKINPQSTLKNFDAIIIEQLQAVWKDREYNRKETIIICRYEPKKEQKKT